MKLPHLALPLCMLAACARGESAEERQLDELRKNMDQVSAEQDRQVPLEAEIHAVAPAPSERAPAFVASSPPRTVHFLPDEPGTVPETGDGDADDPPQLPALRMTGNSAAAKRAATGLTGLRSTEGGDDSGGDGHPSVGAPSGPTGRPAAVDPDARKAYDAAVGLVHSKQYALALESLASFMVKWPDHPYVENATYWRGECFFAQGDYPRAKEQFEGLVARFPSGAKAPDALFRLGLMAQKAGEAVQAKSYFERIIRDYPHSESARHVPREEKK